MDRLGNIEAFIEAAELGSFTRAARRLRLTPSALSRRVAQLEDELGVRLFHRTTRALRLSEDGRAFFERSRSAVRELREAREAASRLRDRPAGLLRVEAPTILGRSVVVAAVSKILARYRELQVDLALRDYATDLASEGIDVAVRLGPLEDSALIARKLGRTRMSVCAAPGYLRRHGTPRSVEDLARHERLGFAVQGRVLPWRLRDGSAIRELPPGRRIVVNSGEAMVDLAVAGAGLAWLCDFMMAAAVRSGQLSEVLADAACEESPVHAVSLPSRRTLPKVRAFVDAVATELAKSSARP